MASGITNAIGKSKLQEKDVTITQNGTYQVAPDTGYDGMSKATIITNVPSTPTEEKTVDLSMASGNQVITPTSGKVLSKVTITKPSTLIASNIKKNVVIAGITGSYEFKTQNKTFTPTQTGGSVSADSGYDGLGVVTVNPVPLDNKTDVPLNFYNQTAGTIADSQNIYSDENKFMTRASVARPATLVAANIKKDVNIAGIVGTLESGGETLPAYTGLLRFSSAPTIFLSNDTLNITAIDNATSYDVYVDGVLKTNVPARGGVAMYKLNWGKYSSSSSVTFEIQVDDNPAYTQTVNQNLINLITEPRKSTQVKFSIANNGDMRYAITYDTQYLTDCIVEIPAGEESNAEYSYIIVKPQSDNALIYLNKGGPIL